VRNCDTCHQGADGDLWKTRPTRSACGSCHDGVSFIIPAPPGMTAHAGGQQLNDNNCTVCHQPSGGLEGITEKHYSPQSNPANPLVELAILGVTNSAPGQQPVMTFEVKVNGAPYDIGATPLTSLRVTVAGPTTDYQTYWQATIQGGGAGGVLAAVDAANGIFSYTLPVAAAIPVSATGSYGFALEGYIQPAGADRAAAFNPIAFAAVTDATAEPRRTVVDGMLCNNCHNDLALHGGARKNANYCMMCHNPTNTNDERISRFESSTVDVPSVDFKVMIHKIHRGEELTKQPYFLYGFPAPNAANPAGSPLEFGEVRFPGDLRDCATCHVSGSFELPLAATVLPTRLEELTCTEDPAADGDAYCNTRVSTEWFLPPTSAVCTSCHDADYTVAHAEVMTSSSGLESCTTCHGDGKVNDIGLYHAMGP
jgi:OmcA/MtrC family decaheme c-type cytochrome